MDKEGDANNGGGRLRKTLGCILVPVVIVGALVVGCVAWLSDRPDDLEVTEIMSIPNSDWIIEIRDDPHFLGGSLGIDVRARNAMTQQTVVIVRSENIIDTNIVYDRLYHIMIPMPENVAIVSVNDAFGPFHVDIFRLGQGAYSDAGFTSWLHDKAAPESVAWYCKYVIADQTDGDRAVSNKFLGKQFFPHEPGRPYCR